MNTFLGSLVVALDTALEPLEASVESPEAFERFLLEFGWDAAIETVDDVFQLQSLFATAGNLVQQLNEGTTGELELAQDLFGILSDIVKAVQALSKRAESTGLVFPLTEDAFYTQLRDQLLDYLLVRYLEVEQPLLFGLLTLAGIVEITPQNPTGAGRVPHHQHTLVWSRLPEVVSDPGGLFRDIYRWDGTASAPFDHERLLRTVERGLLSAQYPVRLNRPRRQLADRYFATGADAYSSKLASVRELVLPLLAGTTSDGNGFLEFGLLLLPIPPSPTADPDGLVVAPVAKGFVGTRANLGGPFTLELSGNFESDGAVLAEIFPDGAGVELATSGVEVDALAAVTGIPLQPWLLVGSRGSHRLEVGGLRVALRVRGPVDDPEIIIEAGTGVEPDPPKLAVVVEFADADSFLQKIIGNEPIRLEAAGGLEWSSKRGLSFSGSAGIVRDIPIHQTLGFVRIDTLTVGLLASTSGGVDIIAALTGNAKVGPVSATAEKVGVKLELVAAQPGESGLFGSLDLAFGFKPPDGLGLSIDAGPVTGGGFLSIDQANGRYAGVLQLQLAPIGITAIGLLDTKLPGGQPGFSFLVIISATFPPIQLGFGFTLNGLGGLAGINRTIVVEALQAGVRNKAVDSVLFPVDPVGNASQLISNLRSFFPPAVGRYVFGPMAIIGWGTPPMVDAELGIILEIPAPVRIVLLGQINVGLPDKRLPAVDLHLDVLGVIDFGAKQLSIDASLHDSRVALFELSGDMAMRLSWGDQPNFAFAVGGFNPHFQPPPAFPELRRLTLALGKGENPRISLQAYLAVTSNTVQVGARADLYAEAGGLNVTGWAGFDALFVFDPFSLQVDISAGMALRRGTNKLASVHVDAHLTGPSPWHAWGKGCLETFLGDICVDFDATFGDALPAAPRPAVDVWALLETAIAAPGNWASEPPPASARVVSFSLPPGASAADYFDPLGTATLRQKVAPLNRELTRYGEASITGVTRFNLSGVAIGETDTGWETVKDYFAEAQFEEMSDAEKLSRPSFTPMDAGVRAGIDKDALSAVGFAQEATYKTVVVDDPERPWSWQRDVVSLPLLAGDLVAQIGIGAAGVATLDHSGLATYKPPLGSAQAVTLAEESFVIVATDDLEPLPDLPANMTKGEAYRVMKTHLASNPAARGTIEVVPSAELATQ